MWFIVAESLNKIDRLTRLNLSAEAISVLIVSLSQGIPDRASDRVLTIGADFYGFQSLESGLVPGSN